MKYDNRMDGLPPFLVWDTNDGDILHGVVAYQGVFNLGGEYILTACYHHVLKAIDM